MKLIGRIHIVLVCLLLTMPAFTQSYQVRIGCFGNSITFGQSLLNPATDSYPGQLQSQLQKVYGDTCLVENFGVPGADMLKKGDMPIWGQPRFWEGFQYAPDILLIMLGTNDSKSQNWDYYADEFYGDYISMIDTFLYRNPNTKLILCYPPPAFSESLGVRDSVIVHGVIPTIDSVLKKYDGLLVDFHTPLVDSVVLFPDKVHPNVEGASVMAQILLDTIIKNDIIHHAELGMTFITHFEVDRERVPVGDSILVTWSTVRADSAWLNGELVDSVGSKKVRADKSGNLDLVAKGELTTDSASIYVETYDATISWIQIDPLTATVDFGEEVELELLYFDQYREQMDTATDIVWTITGGLGELKDQEENRIVFVAGNSEKSVIQAQVSEFTALARIYVTATTSQNKLFEDGIEIFPNPAQNKIIANIDLEKPGTLIFKIIDAGGRVALTRNYFFQSKGHCKIDIDIHSIPSGLYIFQAEQSGIVYTGKFIKK
jgi:acyl-CoA thioesterase I